MDGNQHPLETDESFRAFDRLSQELSSAYFSLAEHAAGLEAELARSRREKERQREAKEHLADRLAALLDSLPGGVVVHDGDGCVSVSNAVARDWFGVELQGRVWADLLVAGRMRLIDDGRELETPDGTAAHRLTALCRGSAGDDYPAHRHHRGAAAAGRDGTQSAPGHHGRDGRAAGAPDPHAAGDGPALRQTFD